MTDHFEFTFVKGETNLILPVFIRDSSVTTGAGLGGLGSGSSITGGYFKKDGLGIAQTVDEAPSTTGTYDPPTTAAKVRIAVPANSVAGTYELHFHDDVFATEDYVFIQLSGATNMRPITITVNLWDFDPNTTPILITDILSDGSALNTSTGTLDAVDAITGTFTELSQGVPTVTPTLDEAMMLIYMALRDKLDVTSTTKEIHNDAGTVIAKKALTDSGGIYSEAKMESGP